MNSMKNSRCFGILMRKKNIWKTWPDRDIFLKSTPYLVFVILNPESRKIWITKLIELQNWLQDIKDKKEFDNYIALFEDAGWKHVYGTKTVETNIFADEWEGRDRYFFGQGFGCCTI